MRNLTINVSSKPEFNFTMIYFIFNLLLITKKKKEEEDNVNFSMSKFEVIKYVKSMIEEVEKQTHKINKVKKDKDYLKSFLDIG